jgi:hypothetical protein
MRSLKELITALDNAPEDAIVDLARDVLSRPADWCTLTAQHLAQIPDSELTPLVLKAHFGWIEPRVYMIFERPGRYQIILHHFDTERFGRFLQEKRIGPHFHHFPFTTRILRGAYVNWLFNNGGALEKPTLSFAGQIRCVTGDIYTLQFDQYHCVLMPEVDTMSLMVRGKAVRAREHPEEPGYGPHEVLALRPRYIDLLMSAAEVSSGRILDLVNDTAVSV